MVSRELFDFGTMRIRNLETKKDEECIRERQRAIVIERNYDLPLLIKKHKLIKMNKTS